MILLAAFGAFISALPAHADQLWLHPQAWHVEGLAGPGYLVEPWVLGSAAQRPLLYPFLDLNINDRLSLNSDDGLYGSIFKTEGFEIGPHVFYSWGRDGSYYASPDREETETVDEAFVLGLSAWHDFGVGEVSLAWDHGLAPGQSSRFVLGLSRALYKRGGWSITLDPELTWATAEYMNTFYGVTPESAEETGLRAYHPRAGFESAGGRLHVRYHWRAARMAVQASCTYFELLDQSRVSPLNETTNLNGFFVAVGYNFSTSHAE